MSALPSFPQFMWSLFTGATFGSGQDAFDAGASELFRVDDAIEGAATDTLNDFGKVLGDMGGVTAIVDVTSTQIKDQWAWFKMILSCTFITLFVIMFVFLILWLIA